MTDDQPAQWTGADLREWAESMARLIDSGKLSLTVDLEHRGVGDDVWSLRAATPTALTRGSPHA